MRRKWYRIAWIVALGGLFCFMAILVWTSREPRYQGRALSSWLKDLDQPNGGPAPTQAVIALRAMAPRAAGRLVPMLEAEDPPLVLWLVNLARKQSFVRIPFTPASTKTRRAELAFDILGTNAVSAAPELVKLLIRRGSKSSSLPSDATFRASTALDRIGPGAIPYLPPALRCQHSRVRYEGTRLLSNYSLSRTPSAMSELFKLLQHPDPRIREAGIYAVSKFHPVPDQTIPRLTPLLQDPEASVRRQAALGLARFGKRATNALPALQQACLDPAFKVKQAAADALAAITGQAVTSSSTAEPD